jgi:6-pyruvoyltetrahydropterin/6-carboxytetrahydropterin synthase
MKISKEFRWEMGHRLPFHDGLCRNIHGHSYKLIVEIEGNVNENGMIIDFYDLGKVINPIIGKLDHSFLCWKGDNKVINFLKVNKMKYVSVDYHSTVENICSDMLMKISVKLKKIKNVKLHKLTLKLFESPNAYAENSALLING